MKKLQQIFSFLLLLVITNVSLAQTGTVKGQLTDESGETIPFANLMVNETGSGASTDLDGFYTIELEAGIYSITVSYIGYADLTASDITVVAGEELVKDLILKSEGEIIDEIVVTASAIRNTEAALMTIQRRSSNVLDGVSAQTFKRSGDGDAGEAIQRVTGVSVEGGKHVYVRGLGDRYTKTILNGMDIPGLDPDRNSVELDIFPTNVIDNIMVFKTSTPDLPGDFTGGVVNIITKDFPDERSMVVAANVSVNPSMHFKSNFLSYQGGATDWLGMDDGTRALPFNPKQNIPEITSSNFYERNAVTSYTSSFSPTMAAAQSSNNVNKSFSFSTGNQIVKEKVTLGYIAALNYRHNTTYYEDAQFNEYVIIDDQFIKDKDTQGPLGETNAFWSALGGLSLKVKDHKFNAQYLRLQNGISSAATLTQKNLETNPSTIIKDNLEYAERSVNNIMVSGKHSLSDGQLDVNWNFAPTFTEVDEPDIRYTAFELTPEGSYDIRPSVGADVSRTFRNLQEQNYNGKVDVQYTTPNWTGEEMKIKAGFLSNNKNRDFSIVNYLFRVRNQISLGLTGDANQIFEPQNYWTEESNTGTYVRGNFEPANSYNATQNILAGYVMNEMPISEKFKAIYGLRVEQATNHYTGQTNDGSVIYNDVKVLSELDFLPSVNAIYSLNDQTNLRVSGSKTVARPSFKEKSLAQIQDRISGRTFLGNIDLEQTNIANFDIRYEHFMERGQIISFSTFYKSFDKPIELVAFDASAPSNFQAKNGGDASVYGVEVELRKSLDFLFTSLPGLSLGTNITLVHSSIDIGGEATRQMVGQSPFIVNTQLSYKGIANGWDGALSYNYQAERLLIAGLGSIPNIYDVPFHSLNIKTSKKLGPDDSWNISLGVDNILAQSKSKIYRSGQGQEGIFEMLNPGRQINVGLSYIIK